MGGPIESPKGISAARSPVMKTLCPAAFPSIHKPWTLGTPNSINPGFPFYFCLVELLLTVLLIPSSFVPEFSRATCPSLCIAESHWVPIGTVRRVATLRGLRGRWTLITLTLLFTLVTCNNTNNPTIRYSIHPPHLDTTNSTNRHITYPTADAHRLRHRLATSTAIMESSVDKEWVR